MRFRSLLLHALLCLALVANGVSGAMASVHSGCDHGLVSNDPVAVAAPAASPPCHMVKPTAQTAGLTTPVHSMGHTGMPLSDGSAQAAVSGHPSNHPDTHPQDDDSSRCCGSTCHCACIAHAQIVLMPAALIAPAFADIAYASAAPCAHTAPALPHLVRPPIA